MALRYYPLSRVNPNKYTRGSEFVLLDGKPYSGRYYETYDNRFFTGINPVLGTNEELIKADTFKARAKFSTTFNANGTTVLKPNSSVIYDEAIRQEPGSLVELKTYVPTPLPSDYERGYFTRYFAKKVAGPEYILEISQQDWSQVQNGNVNVGLLSYETMDMLWQLTGPLNDTRISQYQIQGGVYSTNKRVTESKQKGFRGIVEYIGGDYTKYARITGGSVATSGSI